MICPVCNAINTKLEVREDECSECGASFEACALLIREGFVPQGVHNLLNGTNRYKRLDKFTAQEVIEFYKNDKKKAH